jgi:hypothetical protein
MKVCVYTALHHGALRFILSTWSATSPVWFSSKRRWVTAQEIVPAPILIRDIEDEGSGPLVCRYVADLDELKDADDFGGDRDRHRAWLRDHRAMQRAQRHSEGWPEQKFLKSEVEGFLDHRTHFMIRHLREIDPLPLDRLVKAADRTPLAATTHGND